MPATDKKVTQSYYIKETNRDLLKHRAFKETTIDRRVTDDMLLDDVLDTLNSDPALFDRILDKARKSRSTDKPKAKKHATEMSLSLAA